jgi:CDP-6-deoxy-D-xylo-4-hexulose-3-dehydrase
MGFILTEYDWPLMKNNFAREDLNAAIGLLLHDDPHLTQGPQVRAFEDEWSAWLGCRHSVFVNSGSSANLLSLAALKEASADKADEVFLPAVTWSSDVAAVLNTGFTPVFVDIDLDTLGMDMQLAVAAQNRYTSAVFVTHLLGFNALSWDLLDSSHAPLIEDCCEAHGATFEGSKLGTFGLMSNFSFYYAHHMSTIEGGMICTDDDWFADTLRMLRSHGLAREIRSDLRREEITGSGEVHSDFVFDCAGYNVRNNEIGAVIGRSQLKRLDNNVEERNSRMGAFLYSLDSQFYKTDFAARGCSSFALPILLRNQDVRLMQRVVNYLTEHKIEFRRGMIGGNQLRQPYLRRLFGDDAAKKFPNAEHVHFYGLYVGNYSSLEKQKIYDLCEGLNKLAKE